ncbi:kinase subdomain-containing protein, partial [Calycina marina]
MQRTTSTMHGDEPNPLDTKGLCLLSLDGGGVRGLSTLYILKSIMDRLNYKRSTSSLAPVKPCEVFDLIGGTSTGGLIAIMLGRLEMDVDECITAYSDLAEAVFSQKKSRLRFNLKGKVKAQFDSSKLENAIRDTIKRATFSEAGLFNDGVDRGCRTFVCTVDQNTKGIVRLRSYTLPEESNVSATICQAALATSAATTFFEPVPIGNRMFADGGLGANNPVEEVEGEAANIWCSKSGDLKPLVKCFVSIGTGNPGIKAFEESMFRFLGQTVVSIATETEETEKRFIAKWRKHFDENRYYRFNVDQGLQNIGLDEYKQKGAMESATDRYLVNQAQKNRVRDCIENLKMKQNKTETTFAAIIHEFEVFRIQQQAAVCNVHWLMPFERNPYFTGREYELARIEGMLFTGDQASKVAVYGLGGVGKTSLVIELVHRTRAKHNDCSTFWIPATTMESVQQAYLDIAQQLRIPGWKEEDADIQRLVQGFLSRKDGGQWLLVYDNADDIDLWFHKSEDEHTARGLVDYLPRGKQGAIIFTTRDRKTAFKLTRRNVVEVPQMDESTARQLLGNCLVNQRLVKPLDDTTALLQQLTFLPLAIVQAAAYINGNRIRIADYLSLLNDQEEDVIDLLSEGFEDDGKYHGIKNPVATTWLISFKQIRRRDPLAAEFLSFMACVAPKDVPQSLLPFGRSRKKEVDAMGTLDAYSFISRRPADLALDMHRLVHLAMRNWLRQENLLAHWSERAVTRLAEVFPSHDHLNRSVWKRYLTHAKYALDSDIVDKYGENMVDLAWKFGMCLYRDGRWKEAEDLFVLVMETRK